MAPSRGAQVRRDVSTEKKWAKLVVIRAFFRGSYAAHVCGDYDKPL